METKGQNKQMPLEPKPGHMVRRELVHENSAIRRISDEEQWKQTTIDMSTISYSCVSFCTCCEADCFQHITLGKIPRNISTSMYTSFLATLFTIRYFFGCKAAESESRPLIPPSEPSLDLLERFQDPQRVETWIVHRHPSLQDVDPQHMDIFEGYYGKRELLSLAAQQKKKLSAFIHRIDDLSGLERETFVVEKFEIRDQKDAEEIAAFYVKEHPGTRWTGNWNNGKIPSLEFSRPSPCEVMKYVSECMLIWKQHGLENYVLSYHRKDNRNDNRNQAQSEIVWYISTSGKVLWSHQLNRIDQPPEQCPLFPSLINSKLVGNVDVIWELHGYYKTAREENEKLRSFNQQLTNKLNKVEQEKLAAIEKMADKMGDISLENERYVLEQKRLNLQIEDLKSENERVTAELENFRTENQRLNASIQQMKQINSTEETTEESVSWSIAKWSCIVGGFAFLFIALAVCYGFKAFYRKNKRMKFVFQNDRKLIRIDDRKVDSVLNRHRRAKLVIIQEGMKRGESENNVSSHGFNDLMVNSVAVQDVLMDDVMEEMEAEGAGSNGQHTGQSTELVETWESTL